MPKPVRRIVTGHDESGKAIVVIDGPAPNQRTRAASGVTSTLLWVTEESPADCSFDKVDRADRESPVAPPAKGTILRVVEFPPAGDTGGVSHDQVLKEMGLHHEGGKKLRHPFMHRTRSIDYAICLEGEIDMLLDDSDVTMRAGDIMVQQATYHAWVNNSDKICRICFVLVDGDEPPAWKKG